MIFSQMKQIKTRLRNRLADQNLHQRMKIAIEGPELKDVIFEEILDILNEKVGFKRPTTLYRNNPISCGALLGGTTQWTSGVGWSFRLFG